MASNTSRDLAASVAKLSLKTSDSGTKTAKKKAPAVADSWDEDISSESETENGNVSAVAETPGGTKSGARIDAGTSAPPPTPMSPSYGARQSSAFSPSSGRGSGRLTPPSFDEELDAGSDTGFGSGKGATAAAAEPSKRPEKTDAVARRMIASALGLKAVRPNAEQKAYDRALREKERRRREEEREQERKRAEEAAKARQAVWDD